MRSNSMRRATTPAKIAELRPMLTRDDTAAFLAVSLRTLDRLVNSGAIPAYRIGGHRRFRIEDVESYVASSVE